MADTFKIKDAPMLGYLNKDFELFYFSIFIYLIKYL